MTRPTHTLVTPRIPADTLVLARRPLRPGTAAESTSTFGDDIWQLSPAVFKRHQLAQILDFTTLPANLRHVAKELFLALLRFDLPAGEQALNISTIRSHFSDIKTFLAWADKRGVTSLATLTADDLAAYQQHVSTLRLSPDTRGSKRRTVRLLWLFRTKLSDPLALDPDTALGWDELTINPRRGENATDRIPEPILGPLLAWAVRWVNDFSDDLLTAHAEWLRLHAHTHNNRQRRGAARVPDIPGRLRTLLNRYRQEQRPLPLGDKGVNRTHLAREIGCAHGPLFGVTCGRIIDEAADELGIDDGTYLRTPINARLDGQPWRGAIAYTDIEQLERLLQLACYVVIAYLSGMRDSEKRAELRLVQHSTAGVLSCIAEGCECQT